MSPNTLLQQFDNAAVTADECGDDQMMVQHHLAVMTAASTDGSFACHRPNSDDDESITFTRTPMTSADLHTSIEARSNENSVDVEQWVDCILYMALIISDPTHVTRRPNR
jgi:hypothetical protein